MSTQKQALQILKKSNTILCLTQNPARNDGIACLLAAQKLFSSLGKKTTILLPNGITKNFAEFHSGEGVQSALDSGDFIVSIDTQKTQVKNFKTKEDQNLFEIVLSPDGEGFGAKDVQFYHESQDFDVIVAFDAPNLESLGEIFLDRQEMFTRTPIINVSSEIMSESFGRINLHDVSASSSSEVFFRLLQSDEEFFNKIDQSVITLLLAGIIANTDSFLSENTTASGLSIAADLQEMGASQSEVIEQFFKQKSFKTLKCWGRILNGIRLDPVHKIAYSSISKDDMDSFGASIEDIDQISDEILRFIIGMEYSVLFIENLDTTTAQIRSAKSDIEWEKYFVSHTRVLSDHGIDVSIQGQTMRETENFLLSQIQKMQNSDTKLKKIISQTQEEQISLIQPKAPTEIPFEMDLFSGEKITKEPKNPTSKIPNWLKKSFPSH